MRVKTLILGAGIAGLRLAAQIREAGDDFLVLEQEAEVGGLCRTNRSGRFSWDFGVHALYSRDPAMTDFFRALPFPLSAHWRDAKIYYPAAGGSNSLIDYPFEIGIRDLPLREKMECVAGYVKARCRVPSRSGDLARWIRGELGAGIGRLFMYPYNAKMWACPLEHISVSLVTRKIHPEPVLRFLYNVFIRRVRGREYQARFVYPRQGIQELPDYFARTIRDRIMLRANVRRVKKEGNVWRVETAAGGAYTADTVVSTIPLVELLRMLECPGVEKKHPGLRWNDTFFVFIGLKGPGCIGRGGSSHWIFFAGPEVFYRVTLLHNFSRAAGCSIVAEITRRGESTAADAAMLRERTIADLLACGIIRGRDGIELTETRLVRHTYPIPTHGLSAWRDMITQRLAAQHLHLLGRNGRWEYLNIDETIQQADQCYQNHGAEFM